MNRKADMTTQLASAHAAVEEIPPQTLDTLPGSGGLPDDRALPGNLHSEVVGWLTTVLRPAGSLDRAARRRLGKALDHLAASCDMVIIDLTATQVAAPRALARNLRSPAREFRWAGRCLLLVGAPPDLLAELDRTAVPVIAPPLAAAISGHSRARCGYADRRTGADRWEGSRAE
jgi:hypothetical protein